MRSHARPQIDVAERVRTSRTHPAFIIVGKKLSLVGGNIHSHRAIALAAFAGEAKIERLLDLLASPTVADHLSLSHLPEQVSAAPRGVFFLASGTVARTHQAAFFAAARAYSYAA